MNGYWLDILSAVMIGVFALPGVALLTFLAVPSQTALVWAGKLARDGSMDALTPEVLAALRLPGMALGLMWLLAACFLWRRRMPVLSWLARSLAGLSVDARHLMRDAAVFWTLPDQLFVLAFTVLAVGMRWLFLWQPMSHDESYTVVGFAVRSVGAIMTDYSLPNNHILHTLLVHFSIRLFGEVPWAVRLPAFVAGVACVPAVYLLARRWYNRSAAVLAAAITTMLPVMVLYSTDARGYSLTALLTLLIAALATYLKHHHNRAAWLLLAILSALGFYTLPTMLYAAGAIWLWLLFEVVLPEDNSAWHRRFSIVRPLAVTGVMMVIFVVLCYLPIVVRGSGWHSLVGNPFVVPVSLADFGETLRARMQDTWNSWLMDLPAASAYFVMVGMFLSLLFHRSLSRVRVPFWMAMVLWLAIVLPIQRPNAMARVWVFLVPLVAIYVAAGWTAIFERLPMRNAPRLAMIWAVLLSAILLTLGVTHVHQRHPAWQPGRGTVEHLTQVIHGAWQPGDVVIIACDDSPILWYYSRLYGIPERAIHRLEKELPPFGAAFVVVSTAERQSLSQVIERRGLAVDRFDLSACERMDAFGANDLYRCPPSDQ